MGGDQASVITVSRGWVTFIPLKIIIGLLNYSPSTNILTSVKDHLQFAIDTIKDQRG